MQQKNHSHCKNPTSPNQAPLQQTKIAPHSQTFTPLADYATWAAENGISGAWDDTDADGIANVFRYAFGVAEGTDGLGILDLTFNDQGQVVVQTPPVVNSNGFGLSIATADDPAGTQNPTSHPLDSDGETVIDEPDTGSRTRFYRLKAAPGARYARSDE